jgi:hypothetical protein
VRTFPSVRGRVVVALLGAVTGLLLGLPAAATAAPAAAPAAATAKSPPVGPDGRLDARAAAGRTGVAAAAATGQVSWFSGTVAAGATQFWTWNNANPITAGYEVGFSPVGASTSAPCRFQVTGTRYERHSTGERRFQFDIKNTSSIACGATILLSQADDGGAQGSTVPLSPGQVRNQEITLQHAVLNDPIPIVGLLPGTTGTTPSSPCRIALTDAVNISSAVGVWRYRITMQNIGAVSCPALATVAIVQRSIQLSFGNLGPGVQSTIVWNNANPLNLVYVPLGTPMVLPTGTSCQLRAVNKVYQQNVNPDGSLEREFRLTVANVGSDTCVDTKFYLATLP